MSSGSDLVAHFVPCEYQVTFHGLVFTIPAMDTVGWIRLITADPLSLYAIFPTLAGQECIEHVETVLWEERATSDEVDRLALEIITMAADRPWWKAMKMINLARGAWDILHVNQAVGVPLAGWLDEVWTKTVAHCDPKKLAGLTHELELAPKGFETEVDFDAEELAFMAAMNSVMK